MKDRVVKEIDSIIKNKTIKHVRLGDTSKDEGNLIISFDDNTEISITKNVFDGWLYLFRFK